MKLKVVIYVDQLSNKKRFITALEKGEIEGFELLKESKRGLFSKIETDRLVDIEERLGLKTLGNIDQTLKTMSSGEQKKLLLNKLLSEPLDYLILDNPFESLDTTSQNELKAQLKELPESTGIIQLTGRHEDALEFCDTFYKLENDIFSSIKKEEINKSTATFNNEIKFPKDIKHIDYEKDELIHFKNVSVQYSDKPVLNKINWKINKGEFWQLKGPNGSGKSTLIGMITGDNPKGYGNDLYLFGNKKGSGESIWDIKQKIGYFSPAQIYNFNGKHTVFNMLISGYNDSIGLYKFPTDEQNILAKEWLHILNLQDYGDHYFCDLSMTQQRLLMCARAMVKFPVLLILDEPTVGLDDTNALMVVGLINKISQEYEMGIIYVSHRPEVNLKPSKIFELTKTAAGSTGHIQSPIRGNAIEEVPPLGH